jgi:1,4-alpha-glucan branching enzyme
MSNCRFWLDEFRFDGFRFDGVTSMLYLDHGLEKAFTRYDDYFGDNTDRDALAYLTLANRLIHRLRPDATTIAEDVSGMPGLAAPESEGGTGFDYRFAMGVPDFWIKLIKERPDEDWPMGRLWYELNNRRAEERTISYCESHDQALVGDQTLIFRLMDADIYEHMRADDPHLRADRAIALHKMIRLVTLAAAGHGYLNFMGNEFGHPEWIDFPREGNNWSYHYARRQWRLAEDPELKFRFLGAFDREMIGLARERRLLSDPSVHLLTEHNDDKVLAFLRAGLVFAFNFHPDRSHEGYAVPAPAGDYRMVLDSDAADFGGHRRLTPDTRHTAPPVAGGPSVLRLYLPSRTALVLGPA